MSLVIPNGYAHCRVDLAASGVDTMSVTWGIKNELVAPTVTQVVDGVEDAVQAGWATVGGIMSVVVDDITLNNLNVLYRDSNGDLFSVDRTQSIAGGLTTPPENFTAAWLVKKNTAFAGVRYRGRFFVPGLRDTSVAPDGTVLAGELTSMQTAMSDFLTDLNDAFMPMYLLHGTSAKSATPDPTQVTSLAVQSLIGIQRRRIR